MRGTYKNKLTLLSLMSNFCLLMTIIKLVVIVVVLILSLALFYFLLSFVLSPLDALMQYIF